MGIYTDGNVYGVGWRLYNASYYVVQEYERKFPKKMTLANIQQVKNDYILALQQYPEYKDIHIYFFTKISTTYDLDGPSDECMSKWPGNTEMLQDLFDNGDIPI